MHYGLTDYLRNIVELEKSVYTQTQAINQLMERRSRLGYKNTYSMPNPPDTSVSGEFFSALWYIFLGGCFIGFFIGFFTGSLLKTMLVSGLITASIGLVIFLWLDHSGNAELQANYEQAMQAYHTAVANDEERVRLELIEKSRLDEQLAMMVQRKDQTAALLKKYYSSGIIFPKYRNMIAMCSIYEYFMSGRCVELAGHEGAYNIYEYEIRMERIILKMDEIIMKLEEIKDNQYMLYDAVHEGNRITQKLVDATIRHTQVTERAAANTELAAFYSAQAASELKFQNELHLLEQHFR